MVVFWPATDRWSKKLFFGQKTIIFWSKNIFFLSKSKFIFEKDFFFTKQKHFFTKNLRFLALPIAKKSFFLLMVWATISNQLLLIFVNINLIPICQKKQAVMPIRNRLQNQYIAEKKKRFFSDRKGQKTTIFAENNCFFRKKKLFAE